jgi:hypothetical protein
MFHAPKTTNCATIVRGIGLRRLFFERILIPGSMADVPQQLPRTLWIGILLLLVVLCMAYALSLMELNHAYRHALPVL